MLKLGINEWINCHQGRHYHDLHLHIFFLYMGESESDSNIANHW